MNNINTNKMISAFLTGVAIGGITLAVVEANKFALKSLVYFNFVAIETAGMLFMGVLKNGES